MPRTGFSSHSTFYAGKFPVIDPNGQFYLRHKYEKITLSSDGLDVSTASKWGITDISRSGNTTNCTVTVGAPEAGCEKTFINRSTAASTDYTVLDFDSSSLGIRIDGSSDGRYIKFSSLGTGYQSVTLLGLTSLIWTVKSVNSTVGGFNAAGGIRMTTAASSN